MSEFVPNKLWDDIYKTNNGLSRYPHDSVIRWTMVNFKHELGNSPKFLDLGCGGGRHSIFLANIGCEVSAVDYSSNAIKIAKEWSDRENLNINFDVSSTVSLPFEDSNFDAIISYGVFCYLDHEEVKQSISEISRVLKSGGKCFLVTRSTNDSRFQLGDFISNNQAHVSGGDEVPWQSEIGMKMTFFSKSDIENLFENFKSLNIEHQSFTMCNQKYINDDWIISAVK